MYSVQSFSFLAISFLPYVITDILILFSFKISSNFSSFSPSPVIFQVAYLNRSFRKTCQWLKFPLNGLRVQSSVSPAVGMLPLASGPAWEEQQDTLAQITKQIAMELKITPIFDELLE